MRGCLISRGLMGGGWIGIGATGSKSGSETLSSACRRRSISSRRRSSVITCASRGSPARSPASSGYTGDQMRDLLLAAALHDSGAFSLRERLEIMQYEIRHPGDHAGAGYRLLKIFSALRAGGRARSFPSSAVGVRPRRTVRGMSGAAREPPAAPGGQGQRPAGRPVGPPGLAGETARLVASGSGSLFNPEFVEALAAAAVRPGFWGEVAAPGDDDLREDPAFGEVVLSEADFRGLARLFWQIVDFRSPFTATHTSGVAAVAGFLAPLAGVTGAAGRKVAIAAGLHDLGKLAVPSETLEKERSLSPGEVAIAAQPPAARLADSREDRGPGGDQHVGELPPRAARRPGVPVPAPGCAASAREPASSRWPTSSRRSPRSGRTGGG